MKNKKSAAGIVFISIYLFTLVAFLVSLKLEDSKGLEAAQNRFTVLTRETSQNLTDNAVGSDAFTDRFLDSLGNLSDIAGVQLKYDNKLIFSYPAEIAHGTVNGFSYAKSYSTNISTKNSANLTLITAIYRLKPSVIYRNLKITFIAVLATTLVCFAYALYVTLYDKENESPEPKASGEPSKELEVKEPESDTAADNEEPLEDFDEFEAEEESESQNSEPLDIEPADEAEADEEFEARTNAVAGEEVPSADGNVAENIQEDIQVDDDDDDDFLFGDDLEDETLDEEDFFSDDAGSTIVAEKPQPVEVMDEIPAAEEVSEESVEEEVPAEELPLGVTDAEVTEAEVPEEDDVEDETADDSYAKIQISPAEYTALKEAIDETQAELEAEKNSSHIVSYESDSSDMWEDDMLETETTTVTVTHPKGLFSEKTGFGWEAYMIKRLDSELLRAASIEQDLSLFTIRIQDLTWFSDEGKEIAEFIKSVVSFPDLIFEYETDGCTAILPNTHIDQSLNTADDLYNGITEILKQYGESNRIGIGISAKSLRMISGERLANESQEALRHAFKDETSPIVAFKVNPQKYRNYLAAQAEQEEGNS